MGMWDETCALTSLPILEGDDVVMVIWDAAVLTQWPTEWSHRRGTTPIEGDHLLQIVKGQYDSYGWVEGVDQPQGRATEFVSILFHRHIWDACQTRDAYTENYRMWQCVARDARGGVAPLFTTAELLEYLHVLGVANATRRNLFAGVTFKGHQERDNWSSHVWLLNHAVAQLERTRAKWHELHGDVDEEDEEEGERE